MCGARLFAVRVILLQRYKRFPARPPGLSLAPTHIYESINGRLPGDARRTAGGHH